MANEFIARKGLISLGDTTITGSNSLSGNYALKVANTTTDILTVENDKEVRVYNDLQVGVRGDDNGNAGTLTINGDAAAGHNPKFIMDGGWHGSADKLVVEIGDHSNYGPTFKAHQYRFARSNGDKILDLSGGNDLGVSISNNVVNLGGGIQGQGMHLRTAENLQTFQHTGHVYDWLEWTGGSSTGQGYTFHTRTHKNLLALDGTTGRVGIGTSSPTVMLHVTGAIYTETNITASGHVSASTYYGDGSNLTGISSDPFPYTGSAIISGSLSLEGSGSTIFDVVGSQGQLFSITDSLSGSLFAVKDISGLPIFEVFSDDTVKIGSFNDEAITVSGSHTTMGGTLAIPGISDVSASIAAASSGGGSAYHTWIGGRGENVSQATFGTQWRGGMSGNSVGGSFVVSADTNMLTVSSGTPSVGDTISANNYKIITALIHPAMNFTTIDWYGHFRAYSNCDGEEQHMEIWTLDDVNDLAGFGTTTLTFRGGNEWTYDSTSPNIKPIITSGSISHTGTETTAFIVVSHVPTNPASSMKFVYKFDFTVT